MEGVGGEKAGAGQRRSCAAKQKMGSSLLSRVCPESREADRCGDQFQCGADTQERMTTCLRQLGSFPSRDDS